MRVEASTRGKRGPRLRPSKTNGVAFRQLGAA
jgi:hypothetical protein